MLVFELVLVVLAVVAARCLCVALFSCLYGYRPIIVHHPDGQLCKIVAKSCSTLREHYKTPLWGSSGHLQTLAYGLWGRFTQTLAVEGERTRRSAVVPDGTTVLYDVFEPRNGPTHPILLLLVPGIGNSIETDYVTAFAKFAVEKGYRLAVLNHVGALKNVPITGNRIFTYGGTGDLAAVYNQLLGHYGSNTVFVGVGYSLGASILVKFIAEDRERQNKFLCAVSIGQGYEPTECSKHCSKWSNLGRLYNYHITRNLVNIIERHKDKIFKAPTTKQSSSNFQTKRNFSVDNNCLTGSGDDGGEGGSLVTRDDNGFPTNRLLMCLPDKRVLAAKKFADFDRFYTCPLMRFDSTKDVYEWSSCVRDFYKIPNLPMLIVNSKDDPVVPNGVHTIPTQYTGFNTNALYVTTLYGGHLGFFEGIIKPVPLSWVERLLFEYINIVGEHCPL